MVESPRRVARAERDGVGILHLPEDLSLTQHHGVEPRRHTEEVPHSIVVFEPVERCLVTRAAAQKIRSGRDRRAGIGSGTINFDAIAGGKKDRFVQSGRLAQSREDGRRFRVRHGKAFAQGNRRGVVAQAETEQLHGQA